MTQERALAVAACRDMESGAALINTAARQGVRGFMVDGSPQEVRRRSGDLRRLATEFNIPLEELARLYDVDLNELTSTARIRTFLPILVTRRLERSLRRRSRAKQNPQAGESPFDS
jgi:hypothetical protein